MDNVEIIWKELMKEINNPYGVAGLMGNLFAESSLNPLCKTGGFKGDTGEIYVAKVDDGIIDKASFARDGVAIGLAQWRYWSRKEQLYIWAQKRKESIGDLMCQISFLLNEIKTYKTVWNTLLNASSVKEASDIVMERYEKPANMSEQMKSKREIFGVGYYNVFVDKEISEDSEKVTDDDHYVVTTVGNVFYRAGNGTEYERLGRSNSVPGDRYKWIATSENNWHAIVATVNHKDRVVWMCGDYCKVI